jgi:PII-like signaling protein
VNDDCLKLTVYFGERERQGESLVSDVVLDLFERHQVAVSVLMRGVEGFGIKHQLRSDRLLTLSEDLPLVVVAVDERSAIEHLLPEARAIVSSGTFTLERARLLREQVGPIELSEDLHDATKLTIYCGRTDTVDGRPAHLAVVDRLRARGIAGATVLLGLDGTFHGQRERARFFSRNQNVPLMIISVGEGHQIAQALPELSAILPRPIMTLERIRLCMVDGTFRAAPEAVPARDEDDREMFQKLMVYSGEQARYEGHALHTQLIRSLRSSRVAGATALRGMWGYSHDGPAHGDRFWSLRRHVPIVTVTVDRAARTEETFEIVRRITAGSGVVTSELVPAFHSASPNADNGGLALARRLLGPR